MFAFLCKNFRRTLNQAQQSPVLRSPLGHKLQTRACVAPAAAPLLKEDHLGEYYDAIAPVICADKQKL